LGWESEEAVEQDGVSGERDIDEEYEETASLPGRSRSRSYSHISIEDHLLSRYESSHSLAEWKRSGGRVSQKIYIVTEDLTAMITGFRTSPSGYTMYMAICILTLGLAYLILRWLPKWRIRLIGTQTPLGDCHWVAIEVSHPVIFETRLMPVLNTQQDQYGQFLIHQISKESYGHPLSTVFGIASLEALNHENEEDSDPNLKSLRSIDYRYLRFVYHPLKDKFLSVNGWKDPSWTSAKLMRLGLDADERDRREQVFGRNLIDVDQKPMAQLLIDEVCLLYISGDKFADFSCFRSCILSTSSKLQVWFYGL
jgi:cation-transporting ATPase 13A3/4/5